MALNAIPSRTIHGNCKKSPLTVSGPPSFSLGHITSIHYTVNYEVRQVQQVDLIYLYQEDSCPHPTGCLM